MIKLKCICIYRAKPLIQNFFQILICNVVFLPDCLIHVPSEYQQILSFQVHRSNTFILYKTENDNCTTKYILKPFRFHQCFCPPIIFGSSLNRDWGHHLLHVYSKLVSAIIRWYHWRGNLKCCLHDLSVSVIYKIKIIFY